MTWNTAATVSDVKRAFLADYARGESVKDLSPRYGISLSTGHDLVARAKATSVDEACALRSRAPHRRPTKFGDDVTARVLEVCGLFPDYGPKKIAAEFGRFFDDVHPSVSSVASMMKVHGLTTPSTRRSSIRAPGSPRAPANAPNDVWAVDHKGLLKKSKTEPLTVIDVYARKWLACRPLTDKSYEDTRRAFEELFEVNGVPRVIRMDAGQPWASPDGPLRLTRLSAWWVSLGIKLEIVRCPQENGHVERLHRTIEEMDKRVHDVRRYFERQRNIYNDERPHEGICQQAPSQLYVPSQVRPVARKTFDHTNPEGQACDHVRSIGGNGDIIFEGSRLFISSALLKFQVGLRATATMRTFDVYFFEHHIGTIEDRRFKPVR